MTKKQFKKRWESDEDGGGITFDEIAECAQAWGIASKPRIKPIGDILYAVLKAVATRDAEEYANLLNHESDSSSNQDKA